MSWGGRAWGRAYFAVQAVAGAAWWIAVALSPAVRGLTLGTLDPVLVAIADLPLFVLGSALAAAGIRWAAVVATGWTALVAVGMAVYATVTGLAGWGVLIMGAAAGASIVALALLLLGRIPPGWIIAGPFAFRTARARTGAAHLGATLAQMIVFWGVFLVVLPVVIAWLEARWGLRIGALAGSEVVGPSSWFTVAEHPEPHPVGSGPPIVAVLVGVTVSGVVGLVGALLLVGASALGVWSAVSMALVGR